MASRSRIPSVPGAASAETYGLPSLASAATAAVVPAAWTDVAFCHRYGTAATAKCACDTDATSHADSICWTNVAVSKSVASAAATGDAATATYTAAANHAEHGYAVHADSFRVRDPVSRDADDASES